MKLSRDNSEDLGFVLLCLFSQAISQGEFRKWIEFVIGEVQDYPLNLVDLIDFDGPNYEIYKIIGFTPYYDCSDEERKAVAGIAYYRNIDVFEDSPSREEAINALSKSVKIREKFNELFPFLDIQFESI